MENKEQISFGLRGIATEQFAIIDYAFDKSNDKIEMENGFRFGFSVPDRLISVLSSVSFTQDKGPFILLEVKCNFEISENNWNDLYLAEKKEIVIPVVLARHLAVLAIGTLRGVLHAKLENTSFSVFLLPTINVAEMIKEDVVANIDVANE